MMLNVESAVKDGRVPKPRGAFASSVSFVPNVCAACVVSVFTHSPPAEWTAVTSGGGEPDLTEFFRLRCRCVGPRSLVDMSPCAFGVGHMRLDLVRTKRSQLQRYFSISKQPVPQHGTYGRCVLGRNLYEYYVRHALVSSPTASWTRGSQIWESRGSDLSVAGC